MHEANYHTDRKWAGFVSVLCILGVFFTVIGNPSVLNSTSFYVLVLCLGLILLDTYVGMSISIREGALIRQSHFFMRSRIPIAEITEISYGPTWIMGGSFGYSLRIEARHHGAPLKMEIANVGYSNKTLSSLVNDLKKEKQGIRLDKATQALMRTYQS